MPAALRNGVTLALFAALAAALVSGVHIATRERIALEQRSAEQRALLALLPQAGDGLQLEERLGPADAEVPGWEQPQRVFIARRHGAAVAAILPVLAPHGYGGPIRLLVGIDSEGRITGLRVVSHRETPGLGGEIEPGRSDWLRQFHLQSLQRTPPARWAVTGEQGAFDQITGATVTSRAAIGALRQTLAYFAAHRAELMGAAAEETHGQ